MISKNMYKVLKVVPHAPDATDYNKLCEKNIHNKTLLLNLLDEAMNKKFIDLKFPDTTKNTENRFVNFYLTEAGQISIEEYKSQKGSSAKATWAIIISILSLIVSAIAIILKI